MRGWRWATWTKNGKEILVQGRPSSGEKVRELDLGQVRNGKKKSGCVGVREGPEMVFPLHLL